MRSAASNDKWCGDFLADLTAASVREKSSFDHVLCAPRVVFFDFLLCLCVVELDEEIGAAPEIDVDALKNERCSLHACWQGISCYPKLGQAPLTFL